MSKLVCEVSWYYRHFDQIILCCGLSHALEDVGQHPWPLPTRSQLWETANILKISKSIKLLLKMKNMSFLLWKKHNGLFGQPNRSRCFGNGCTSPTPAPPLLSCSTHGAKVVVVIGPDDSYDSLALCCPKYNINEHQKHIKSPDSQAAPGLPW